MSAPEILTSIAIKAAWSTVGSFLALIVVPPKTKTEALSRGIVSIIAGTFSGKTLQWWLNIPETVENAGFAFILAAFLSWWILGALPNFVTKYFGKD